MASTVVHLLQNKVEKKKLFFEEIYAFFTKYRLFAEKMFLYGKKFYIENFFLKKTFFTKKNINENVKNYISHLRNIFLCRKCLCYK